MPIRAKATGKNPPREPRKVWAYRGVNIHPNESDNAYGFRWWAMAGLGFILRGDTKQSMRDLVNEHLPQKGK